jgi:hypothetical protein
MIARIAPPVLAAVTATLMVGMAPGQSTPPNPHWDASGCGACHGERAPAPIQLREAEALCASCHDVESVSQHIHPVGVPLGRLEEPILESGVPLADGKLGCASCHNLVIQCLGDIDARSSNRLFLRSGGGDIEASCFVCHPVEPFQRFNPHEQIETDGSLWHSQCLFCHEQELDPERFRVGDPLHLRAPVHQLCNNCHHQADHPRGVNHLVPVDQAMVETMIGFELAERLRGLSPTEVSTYLHSHPADQSRLLPLGADGTMSCSTCHNPHERGVLPESNPLSSGAESAPIRFHRLRMPAQELCKACHGI